MCASPQRYCGAVNGFASWPNLTPQFVLDMCSYYLKSIFGHIQVAYWLHPMDHWHSEKSSPSNRNSCVSSCTHLLSIFVFELRGCSSVAPIVQRRQPRWDYSQSQGGITPHLLRSALWTVCLLASPLRRWRPDGWRLFFWYWSEAV